jgi:Ca2+/Na+ antiporter
MAGGIIFFLILKFFIIEGFKISYWIGYSLLVSYICELAKNNMFLL